ncbi:MAG: lysozyme, partial [Bacteroidia bacterium]
KPITIGWGSIMKKDGNRFILGDTITQQEADSFLEWEVNNKANTLNILVKGVMLRQNQFDALVSFIYNLGVGNLSSSTLLKKIKVNPSDSMIRLEFLRWNKANHKVMGGLTRRRQAEADLYFKPE